MLLHKISISKLIRFPLSSRGIVSASDPVHRHSLSALSQFYWAPEKEETRVRLRPLPSAAPPSIWGEPIDDAAETIACCCLRKVNSLDACHVKSLLSPRLPRNCKPRRGSLSHQQQAVWTTHARASLSWFEISSIIFNEILLKLLMCLRRLL